MHKSFAIIMFITLSSLRKRKHDSFNHLTFLRFQSLRVAFICFHVGHQIPWRGVLLKTDRHQQPQNDVIISLYVQTAYAYI